MNAFISCQGIWFNPQPDINARIASLCATLGPELGSFPSPLGQLWTQYHKTHTFSGVSHMYIYLFFSFSIGRERRNVISMLLCQSPLKICGHTACHIFYCGKELTAHRQPLVSTMHKGAPGRKPREKNLNQRDTMKNPKLNSTDRAAIQAIADVMMQMNARNDANANQHHEPSMEKLNRGTFGHLWCAIVALVFNSTDRDIRNADWNLGGNASWVDDIQAAIYAVVDREHDAERQRVCESCPDGNLTLPAVRDALKAHGVRIRKEKSEDFVVSHKADNPGQWFISSSLLECFEQGQRKALCALSGRVYVSPY